MTNWRLLGEDHPDAAWDEALQSLPDHCVFQSSAWARHKKSQGWTPRRVLASGAAGAPVAAAQFLMKRGSGACLLWSRGGPAGEPAAWDEGLRRALREGLGPGPVYMRICSYRPEEPRVPSIMEKHGWTRAERPLNRNLTFILDLAGGQAALEKGLSANWGHNLRRGLKRCAAPRPWQNPKPEELLNVYRSMESYKAMKPQYESAELASLTAQLGGRLLLLRLDDASGTPIALRACAVQENKAWDLLAASTEVGRKCYASYALLWSLLERCRELGVKTYDLGGADPEAAKGVYDFKKGTGAGPLEFLGEWDWAAPALLRRPAGLAVKLLAGGAG